MTTLELTPSITLPSVVGLTFRPARVEDLPALHELELTTLRVGERERVEAVEDLRTQFDDPWSNPETDSLAGFTAEGRLVAFARSFIPPQPEREVVAHLWLEIHPDYRAPELIATVFDWLEGRATERLHASHADLPRSLRTGTPDHVAWYIALFETRGYRPIRYFYRMRRDLSEPIPAAPLPPGFAFSRHTPELDHAMHHVFNESFRDHWGYQPVSYEEWGQFFTKRGSFRPDLSLLILDQTQGEPKAAGISYNVVDIAENAWAGIKQGWIGELGVLRAYRKRGLATALLAESMRRFKAEGLDHATLGVDSENPTGALGIYEHVGFKVVKRMQAMEKAVL